MADDNVALEWRPVQGFPDYEIREDGVIRRNSPDAYGRGSGRIVSPRSALSNGKRSIALSHPTIRRKQIQLPVSDLVACAFIGPRPTNSHISSTMDKDPDNLNYRNISWIIDDRYIVPDGIEWKAIPSFPDYEISESGIVRRLTESTKGRKKSGRVVRQIWDVRNDHFSVTIVNSHGVRRTCSIGNLLARAFWGDPPTPQHEAAHNDGNPRNNHYSNIRWATRTENSDDRILHGTRGIGQKNPNAVLSNGIVMDIRKAMEHPYHGQIADLSRHYGVSEYAVHCVKHSKTWKYI